MVNFFLSPELSLLLLLWLSPSLSFWKTKRIWIIGAADNSVRLQKELDTKHRKTSSCTCHAPWWEWHAQRLAAAERYPARPGFSSLTIGSFPTAFTFLICHLAMCRYPRRRQFYWSSSYIPQNQSCDPLSFSVEPSDELPYQHRRVDPGPNDYPHGGFRRPGRRRQYTRWMLQPCPLVTCMVCSVEAGNQPEPNHTFPDLSSPDSPFVSAYRGDPQTCGGRPACRINPTRVAVRGVPF